MPNLLTIPYKGTRDFYPNPKVNFVNKNPDVDDFTVRQYIFDTWRQTMKNLGFYEYDAPIFEQTDLYIAKSGQDLGSKQLYSLTDKKNRKLALRPEMTPSLARMIANKYEQLRFPLRWFSVPNCFRYENPQKGRLREHWQLNVDLIGLESGEAEIEILNTVISIMSNFGATKNMYQIQINSRNVLDMWFCKQGLELHKEKILPIIDDWLKNDLKLNKKLLEEFLDPIKVELLIETFEKKGSGWMKFLEIVKTDKALKLILDSKETIFKNIDIELFPNIVRGQAYYTGLVFEVFDKNPLNSRSLFGGGRYDNLLSLFNKPDIPGIGFGMGDVTMKFFLENWQLFEKQEFLNWKKVFELEKVGIILLSENKIKDLFTYLIPKIISKNKTFEIDYNYSRNPKKRRESLNKKGCKEIIEL